MSMADKWKTASGGDIRLVIYPDGAMGGEADMVRTMRIGNLDAALMTAVGLADLERGVTGLQNIPMAFDSLEEVDYVSAKLGPMLGERLETKGFVVLFWSDTGWVRYFSRKPLVTPADLKTMKVFVWAGSQNQVDLLRKSGYNPVSLETGEILTGLQTGLIDVLSTPPIYALASQIDKRAPYMLELNWAPLVGALVLKKSTWEKIPANIRPALMKSAQVAGEEIQENSRIESDKAVAAMIKRGLKVQPVSPELEVEWRQATESYYPDIRGNLVPADVFDETVRLIKEYRAANP